MSDTTNWESVPLRDLFTFERGKEKNMASLKEGDLPLVSARNVNNGVKGFVGNPTKTFSGGNVITLNNGKWNEAGSPGAFHSPPAAWLLPFLLCCGCSPKPEHTHQE